MIVSCPLQNGLSVGNQFVLQHGRPPSRNRAEQDAFVWVSTEINAEMIDNYPNIQKALRHSASPVELYTDYAKRRLTQRFIQRK